jgi:hypothetical protein
MGEEVNYPERFVNKPRVKGLTTKNLKRKFSISEASESITSDKNEEDKDFFGDKASAAGSQRGRADSNLMMKTEKTEVSPGVTR